MRGRVWEPDVVRSVWEFVRDTEPARTASGPEWSNWREGYIAPRVTKRVAKCAGCGGRIERGESVLYALDCESGPGGGWTPFGRYLHREPCIPMDEET